jgi:hypothetical protein
VISVDAKQRELVGNFKNPGRTWRQTRLDVLESDYPSQAKGVAIPFGIYFDNVRFLPYGHVVGAIGYGWNGHG